MNPVRAAYDLIPESLHDLLRPDWLCGVDPVFAGLHPYAIAADGRSYGATAHVAPPDAQSLAKSNRATTVVLPVAEEPWVIVHELGHVLHDRLGHRPVARPVTWYAQTSPREAFAESFTAWVMGARDGYGAARGLLYAEDRQTVALFEELVA